VDTDEADKVCRHYSSCRSGVANICRYCTVLTKKCDLVTKSWSHKMVCMVQKLIDMEDLVGLKAISQQYIQNALYPLRFGLHNGHGIHGACPLEMLHAILLGMFKYINECFFLQIGPKSMLAKEINALAQKYGELFDHQSELGQAQNQILQRYSWCQKNHGKRIHQCIVTYGSSTAGHPREGSYFARERNTLVRSIS
jgi:hypothetical protein